MSFFLKLNQILSVLKLVRQIFCQIYEEILYLRQYLFKFFLFRDVQNLFFYLLL